MSSIDQVFNSNQIVESNNEPKEWKSKMRCHNKITYPELERKDYGFDWTEEDNIVPKGNPTERFNNLCRKVGIDPIKFNYKTRKEYVQGILNILNKQIDYLNSQNSC